MAAEFAVDNWSMLDALPPTERMELIRDAHKDVSGKAASQGDAVHDLIEAWNTGTPWPEMANRGVNSAADQFISFLNEKRPRFIESEFTVWSREHGYAGTGDALAEIGGKLHLIDWKTGKGLYPEMGLQLAALAHADFLLRPDGTEEELPFASKLTLLHLRPRSWKMVQVDYRLSCFKAFLACREIFAWTQETAPEVLHAAAA